MNPQLKLIKVPVILVVDGEEKQYSSGDELIFLTFEKNYIIESITAKDDSVIVSLKEDDRQLSSRTSLINVDMLILDGNVDILLSWRDDEYCGTGWHIPGYHPAWGNNEGAA